MQHSPNVYRFECDEYGHIAMDCPDRIPPSGMPQEAPLSHKASCQINFLTPQGQAQT